MAGPPILPAHYRNPPEPFWRSIDEVTAFKIFTVFVLLLAAYWLFTHSAANPAPACGAHPDGSARHQPEPHVRGSIVVANCQRNPKPVQPKFIRRKAKVQLPIFADRKKKRTGFNNTTE